jgi:hypothetical protein
VLCAGAAAAAPDPAAPGQQQATREQTGDGAPARSRRGVLHQARVRGIDDFHGVVELLRAQLKEHGWTELEQIDVDIMLPGEGPHRPNKLLSLFAPGWFAQAIVKRPALTLLAAQRILVYQEAPAPRRDAPEAPGDIVMLFLDPAVVAGALAADDDALVTAIRQDLTVAVGTTAAFFRGPKSLSVVPPPTE